VAWVLAAGMAAAEAADDLPLYIPDVKTIAPKAELSGIAINLLVPHGARARTLDAISERSGASGHGPARTAHGQDFAAGLTAPAIKNTLTMPVQRLAQDAPPADKDPGPAAGVPIQVAWQRYAADVSVAPGKPRIVIVLDDLGIRKKQTLEAINIDAPLTLAFLPYASRVSELTALAREKGHELMVHVPMQPLGPENPGPNALRTDLDQTEVQRRLDWALSQFEGYVGANNHMGSKFTQDDTGLATVMKTMRSRGLLFLDSVTGPSRAAGSARLEEVPFLRRDVFIDHFINESAIRKYLKQLESTALKNGFAIGIGHPHDITLSILKEWLVGVQARGFQIVPISAVMREQQATTVQAAARAPAPDLQRLAQSRADRAGY